MFDYGDKIEISTSQSHDALIILGAYHTLHSHRRATVPLPLKVTRKIRSSRSRNPELGSKALLTQSIFRLLWSERGDINSIAPLK